MATLINSLLSLLFFVSILSLVNGQLNVADFGARGDGQTDASQAFLSAWAAACDSPLPMTIYVPSKRYLLAPIVFQGPCNNTHITFRLDGSLVAPADYSVMAASENWVLFDGVVGVSIIGGHLDGQGSGLWACKDAGGACPDGAASLAFYGAKDVVVANLMSINSKLEHIVIDNCENITLEGVRIHAPGQSPNTDGIHVQLSTGVRILNTGIRTGDDCISIGPGTQNLWIQRVACGPGHGISIGSLGKDAVEDGVQNVTVKSVVFTATQNGLRIKTWGKPSKGFVRGVVFEQVVMKTVHNPIIIDQNYCPRNENCPNQDSGVKISEVRYNNIKGTSASGVALKLDCSASSRCEGIVLQDIKLTYLNQPAESFCQNVDGTSRGLVMPNCL